MTRRWLAVTVGALVTVLAAAASADTPPSVWERAKDPRAGAADDLHETVQKLLLNAALLERAESFARRRFPLELRMPDATGALAIRQQAIGMLERAGAEKSPDPRLRYDLGEALAATGNHVRAAAIYREGIAAFPSHSATDRAWLQLAFACGHIGDHVCEHDAWREVLRRETEDTLRLTPTLNLAETQMHLGDLKEAIEGYREAFRLAGRVTSGDTAPLAAWGLAVALDRAGDRLEADKQAKLAVDLERSMGRVGTLLHSENVFFVPDYEVRWYDGLEAMVLAREATRADDARALWERAVTAFSDYVKRGEAKGDRWLPMAKARLKLVTAERERALKRPMPAPEAESGPFDLSPIAPMQPPVVGPGPTKPPPTKPPSRPRPKRAPAGDVDL